MPTVRAGFITANWYSCSRQSYTVPSSSSGSRASRGRCRRAAGRGRSRTSSRRRRRRPARRRRAISVLVPKSGLPSSSWIAMPKSSRRSARARGSATRIVIASSGSSHVAPVVAPGCSIATSVIRTRLVDARPSAGRASARLVDRSCRRPRPFDARSARRPGRSRPSQVSRNVRTASPGGASAIISPWSSTIARSQIWRTRSAACVTNRIVRPSRWNRATRSRHLRWNASSPTDEHLVDEQDVGVDVHRDREPEPHVHARRVVPHLHVDELLELGERRRSRRTPASISRLRQPEDRRVHEDVLAAGQLGVEAGAELEQRGHPAARADLALGRLQDAGDALQQRRLARAVVAEQPDGRALLDVEVDVVERREVLERDRARSGSSAPSATSSARGRGGSASRRARISIAAPVTLPTAPRRSSPRLRPKTADRDARASTTPNANE